MDNSIVLCTLVMSLGLFGMATSKNIIKSIICLNVTQTAIILFLLHLFHNLDADIPMVPLTMDRFTDPLPQALMITTIVIGAAVTSIALLMSIKVFHYYGTLDWTELFSKDD